MTFTKNQLVIIGIGGFIILFFVLLFTGVLPGLRDTEQLPQINLRVFGIDDEKTFKIISESYTQQFPNVTIEYTQFPESTYEQGLINALASGNSPDILYFHNQWLPKHGDKIAQAPIEQKITANSIAQTFPNIVEQDFVANNSVYAIPLYIDTLALLYNKDIFDRNAISFAPNTWRDIEKIVPQFRQLTQQGQLIKPAIALGGSNKNIPYAADLLSLLMMQFGSAMEQRGEVQFGSAGQDAFNYYLQFSNPANKLYTWNESFNATDDFGNGELAMTFGYASDVTPIQVANPFLRVGIAPMPQRAGTRQPINYADYWGLAVSRQSQNASWAWHFLSTFMSNDNAARQYLESTGKPPARRTLINEYLNDAQVGIFAQQSLTARSWPQPDNTEVSRILSETIQSVINGQLPARSAIQDAQKRINNL